MTDLTRAIATVRESIVAILRVRMTKPEREKHGKVRPAQFQVTLGGTAFCVLEDRYLLTAFHVLNDSQPRDPRDAFSAFVVPANGDDAFRFPIVAFPVERPDVDVAVLELGPCETEGVHIPALRVGFAPRADGTRVLTVGYPAPLIEDVALDAQGRIRGGRFFLKSHANEGIVSASYSLGGVPAYELNVDWHHGESGGPIVDITDAPAAFSMMQHYRNVRSPHGIVAGPHRGCALGVARQELEALGVVGV